MKRQAEPTAAATTSENARVAVIILFFSPKRRSIKRSKLAPPATTISGLSRVRLLCRLCRRLSSYLLKTGCGCACYLRQQLATDTCITLRKLMGLKTNPEYEHQKRDKRRGLPQVYVADIAVAVRLPMAGFIAIPREPRRSLPSDTWKACKPRRVLCRQEGRTNKTYGSRTRLRVSEILR